MSMFHVYHNNCAPRFFSDFRDAEQYADEIMQEETQGYQGTKLINESSKMSIVWHQLMRRNDPNKKVVYENMYNIDKIRENNRMYNERIRL